MTSALRSIAPSFTGRALGFVGGVAMFGLGCPSDDPEQIGAGSTGEASSATTSSGGSSSTTQTPTSTTEPATVTTETSSSTGSAETTDGSTTGGSTGTSAETDICEPGGVGCVCDDGQCDDELACLEDICVALRTCDVDVDAEPNDAEDAPTMLAEIACDMVFETLGNVDATDEDWFTVHGVDDGNCDEVSIAIVESDPALDVCMYFSCDEGIPQVTCGPGDAESMTTGMLPGCCGTGDVTFNSTRCNGAVTSDSGDLLLVVSGTPEAACVDYELAYRFK